MYKKIRVSNYRPFTLVFLGSMSSRVILVGLAWSGNEIWPVYVTLQKKIFYEKVL